VDCISHSHLTNSQMGPEMAENSESRLRICGAFWWTSLLLQSTLTPMPNAAEWHARCSYHFIKGARVAAVVQLAGCSWESMAAVCLSWRLLDRREAESGKRKPTIISCLLVARRTHQQRRLLLPGRRNRECRAGHRTIPNHINSG
jgi:hypothetical protein